VDPVAVVAARLPWRVLREKVATVVFPVAVAVVVVTL
jgi:hypothetical protein